MTYYNSEHVKESSFYMNFPKYLNSQVNVNFKIINENTGIHLYFLEKSAPFYENKKQCSLILKSQHDRLKTMTILQKI